MDGRCGSDPALLWLWYRLAAVALIHPLVQEHPYAADAALKSEKKKSMLKSCLPVSQNVYAGMGYLKE